MSRFTLPTLPRAWDTASAALAAMARAFEDERAVDEVQAVTGLAFRIAVDDSCSLASLHAYPWDEVLRDAALRLGYRAEIVSASAAPSDSLAARARKRLRELVRAGTIAGRATMLWGVHGPEFGIARGMSDDRAYLQVSGFLDGAAPDTLALEDVGRGAVPLVWAMQLAEREAPSAPDLSTTISAAIEALSDSHATRGSIAVGLSAWDRLVGILESGAVDPAGLSYFAQRIAEARRAAATWLLAQPEEAGLATAAKAFADSAGLLAEMAHMLPFPPQPGAMFTSGDREQIVSLVDEVRKREAEGLRGLVAADLAIKSKHLSQLTCEELARGDESQLFACLRDLPVAGLSREADTCRERAELSRGLRALVLRDGDRVVGQLIFAALDTSSAPVRAQGRRWFLYCPWISAELRGLGLGTKMLTELAARARQEGVDGVLTLATNDASFLHGEPLLRHGFTEVDHRGDLRLLELSLSGAQSYAKLSPPREAVLDDKKRLPVLVRHAYHCPLLLRTRLGLAAAARELSQNIALDEADARTSDPEGAEVAGQSLIYGYVAKEALVEGLAQQAARWGV